jgi:hypothetical protein
MSIGSGTECNPCCSTPEPGLETPAEAEKKVVRLRAHNTPTRALMSSQYCDSERWEQIQNKRGACL